MGPAKAAAEIKLDPDQCGLSCANINSDRHESGLRGAAAGLQGNNRRGQGAMRRVLIRLTVMTKHADNGVARLQEKHPWQSL